jgi:mannose-6-phosphate isomerase-like protein (cupin superfamily)
MSRSGDIYVNRVSGERAVIRQGTEDTLSGDLVADLYVRPGGAVIGEHLHESIDERLTVISGEVGISVAGQRRIASAGEAVEVPAGTVHDWWNAGDEEAHVLVEVRPGVRFEEMIVTFWGLANTGRTNRKGMPGILQLALAAKSSPTPSHSPDRRAPFSGSSSPHLRHWRACADCAAAIRSSATWCKA